VRRKLSQLATRKRGKELMSALAQQRIAGDQDRVAFLYRVLVQTDVCKAG
jgi:hypothetical protein